MWSLSLITPPSVEPVVVGDLQTHSRLSLDELADQSGKLTRNIVSAREACEQFTGRQLIEATWELWLSSWYEKSIYRDGVIRLPKPPFISLESIKYLDTDGTTEVTMDTADRVVVGGAGPRATHAVLFPAFGLSWPPTSCRPQAIKIRFKAGYGAAATAVPAGLIDGIMTRVAEMYERREEVVTGTIVTPLRNTAEAQWWPYVTEF